MMPRYRGMTTSTWCPSRDRANGRAPMTSARPPVLANGTASDATVRMRTPHYVRLARHATGVGRTLYNLEVAAPTRPARPPRSETREVAELRAIRSAHPELSD